MRATAIMVLAGVAMLAGPSRADGIMDMATSAAKATSDAASATAGMAGSAASAAAGATMSAASAAGGYASDAASATLGAASATADAAMGYVPDLSDMPSLTEVATSGFTEFTDQVGAAMPVLAELGFEVSTFRVTWGLPPKAKMRLRASGKPKPRAELEAIASKAGDGIIAGALVSSAVSARSMQGSLGFETAVIDVDFSLTPKVKMSFLQGKEGKPGQEGRLDDLDLMCGAAFSPR